MNIKNTFFGFTDNMAALRKGRAEKTLDKLVRVDGSVMFEKEFIYNKLIEGYKTDMDENYSYYSSRTGDMTKPRKAYFLRMDEFSYEVSKTLYDFANYLLENDYLDEKKALAFIQKEQEKIEQLKAEEERKQQEEQRKQEEARQEEEKKRKERQEEYNSKYSKLGKEFIGRLGYDPVKELLDKYVPMYVKLDEEVNSRVVPSEEAQTFYNNLYNKYVVMIGNYGYCNNMIKHYADEYKNNEFEEYEFENIFLFLEQQMLFSIYKDVKLDDHVNTINSKMKSVYNNGYSKAS